MKNPFDWHHSLLYADKSREEYTMEKEGTLDHLLYQMYMVAHDFDGLNMSSAVKALNTAYYLAVAIYNTPHVEESNNVDIRTYNRVRDILAEEHPEGWRKVTHADVFLVRWLTWAILKLQLFKPAGLEIFLGKFQKMIGWNDDRDGDDQELWSTCSFILKFPEMVEALESSRFESDLNPNALWAFCLPDYLWKAEISSLSFDEIEQLLRHYRSKADQEALLDWSQQHEKWFADSSF